MSDRREPRIIKRYANRKLYDMSESCYITHEEIAALVRHGEEVRIIDNRTQEDLTSATLTQILLDEEKRVKRPLPIDTLRNFFQTGGDFIQKKIKQPVASLREEAEEKVRRVFGRREDKAAPEAPEAPPAPQPVATKPKPAESLKEAIEERWLEIQHSLAQLDFPKRINDLERRIEELEAEVAALRGGAVRETDPLDAAAPGDDELT